MFSDNQQKAGNVITTILKDGIPQRTYQMPKVNLLKRGTIS